jgi:hypothetical protein
MGKSLPFSGKISVRQGIGVIVAVGVSEGMEVGKSVGNEVLDGVMIRVGSSEAVAEAANGSVGASVPV